MKNTKSDVHGDSDPIFPSVGLILCASKNDEVVEYAMSRTMSPMMVSQYQLQLPDKE